MMRHSGRWRSKRISTFGLAFILIARTISSQSRFTSTSRSVKSNVPASIFDKSRISKSIVITGHCFLPQYPCTAVFPPCPPYPPSDWKNQLWHSAECVSHDHIGKESRLQPVGFFGFLFCLYQFGFRFFQGSDIVVDSNQFHLAFFRLIEIQHYMVRTQFHSFFVPGRKIRISPLKAFAFPFFASSKKASIRERSSGCILE